MKTGRSEVSTSLRAADFEDRSHWRGWVAIGHDYGLIVLIAWLSATTGNGIAYLIAIWLIGLVQLGLGEMLTHEAAHSNLFKVRRFNQWAEAFCCLPFFFTLNDYRKEHREHHRLLNTDRERLHQDYADHGLLSKDRNLVWLWFFKPVLGYAAFAYIRSVIQLGNFKSAQKVLAFWVALVSLALWGGWLDLLVLYWLVPMLWSFSSYFYWSEIEDHFLTRSGTRTNVGWTNRITHNNGYHDVHHRHPRIPWYRLKQAHEALCKDSPDISRGFLDTYKQIASHRPPEAHQSRS